jgi:phosphatidate cytidylyltransferase
MNIASATAATVRPPVPASGRNLAVRIASATVLGVAVIASIAFLPILFDLIVILGGILAAMEWVRMSRPHRGFLLFGAVYILAPMAALIALNHADALALIFLLGAVWGTDIFAYAAGRAIGGPKLAPAISPNKTWAGAIGGLIGGVAVAMAIGVGLRLSAIPETLITAILLCLSTEAGDLLESAFKRRFGVKDSGWLIPGHGGILDRVDGLLLAAPVYAAIFYLVETVS